MRVLNQSFPGVKEKGVKGEGEEGKGGRRGERPILEGTLGSRHPGPGRAGMAPTSGPGWVRNALNQSAPKEQRRRRAENPSSKM